jgi:hypothetical protein
MFKIYISKETKELLDEAKSEFDGIIGKKTGKKFTYDKVIRSIIITWYSIDNM